MTALRTLCLSLLMIASLSATGCNEDEEAVDESFTLMGFDSACIPAALSSGIIVQTQEAYDDLAFPAQCNPPAIDLESNTLIGVRTNVAGCEVEYERSIDRTPSTLTYRIRINATGSCEKLNTSNNWITVPKVGPNTEVVFDVQ